MLKLCLNERLRELRIKSGYTQSQVAKILNIDRSTYSYYEIGKTTPDVSVLVTLAKVFNIPIDQLLSDENAPKDVAERHFQANYIHGKKNSSHIYELSDKEKELVGAFRICSKEQQNNILTYLEHLSASENNLHKAH